jgi:hypothetical protein
MSLGVDSPRMRRLSEDITDRDSPTEAAADDQHRSSHALQESLPVINSAVGDGSLGKAR